jgi:hypothetical protein
MADNQELVEVLRQLVEQHVQANTPAAATFAATFGDGVDSAAQWLSYQLTSNTGEIAQILAGSHTTTSPEQASTSATTAVDAIVQEALADVPGAEELSQEEIDRILLEVLSEEEEG